MHWTFLGLLIAINILKVLTCPKDLAFPTNNKVWQLMNIPMEWADAFTNCTKQGYTTLVKIESEEQLVTFRQFTKDYNNRIWVSAKNIKDQEIDYYEYYNSVESRSWAKVIFYSSKSLYLSPPSCLSYYSPYKTYYSDYCTTSYPFICERSNYGLCLKFPVPSDGSVQWCGDLIGEYYLYAEVMCDAGLRMEGPSKVFCINGLNKPSIPKCQPMCEKFNVKNGTVTYSNSPVKLNTIATISCLEPYYLFGKLKLTCGNGTWDFPPPLCVNQWTLLVYDKLDKGKSWWCAMDFGWDDVGSINKADSCFRYVQGDVVYNQAADMCDQMGGYLSDIKNDEELYLFEMSLKKLILDEEGLISCCPRNNVYFNGSCYSYVNTVANWLAAQEYCSISDSNLVSVHTSAERKFILHYAQKFISFDIYGMWIGATDSDVESKWVWTDGTPMDYTFWWTLYREPTNLINENCLAALQYGNDLFAYDTYCNYDDNPYICKKPLKIFPILFQTRLLDYVSQYKPFASVNIFENKIKETRRPWIVDPISENKRYSAYFCRKDRNPCWNNFCNSPETCVADGTKYNCVNFTTTTVTTTLTTRKLFSSNVSKIQTTGISMDMSTNQNGIVTYLNGPISYMQTSKSSTKSSTLSQNDSLVKGDGKLTPSTKFILANNAGGNIRNSSKPSNQNSSDDGQSNEQHSKLAVGSVSVKSGEQPLMSNATQSSNFGSNVLNFTITSLHPIYFSRSRFPALLKNVTDFNITTNENGRIEKFHNGSGVKNENSGHLGPDDGHMGVNNGSGKSGSGLYGTALIETTIKMGFEVDDADHSSDDDSTHQNSNGGNQHSDGDDNIPVNNGNNPSDPSQQYGKAENSTHHDSHSNSNSNISCSWSDWSPCNGTCDGRGQKTKFDCNDNIEIETCEWECDPPDPLTPTERIVAILAQSFGCTTVLGLFSFTAILLLMFKIHSLERILQMCQEISIIVGHAVIFIGMKGHFSKFVCSVFGAILHYTFLANFTFLLLESLHCYCILQNIVSNGGFFDLNTNLVVGFGIPIIFVVPAASFMFKRYPSTYSCWLNYGDPISFLSVIPVALLGFLALIFTEAAAMGNLKRWPNTSKEKFIAAMVGQKGLLCIIPFNLMSWLFGTISLYNPTVPIYSAAFVSNVCLAIIVFIFHTLINDKVRTFLAKKVIGSCKKIKIWRSK